MRRTGFRALVPPAALLVLAGCVSDGLRPPYQCNAFSRPSLSPYALPYAPGTAARVIRTFAHYTPRNGGVGLYAVDFELPIGTPVHAARAGTVVAVQERYADGNGENLRENFVFVQHADGTVARYMHLTRDGVTVGRGASVAQGALLGYSGNSGQSTEPHLHFDVQRCGPNLPPDYNRPPCGQTLPVSFRDADSHSCGLVPGRAYVARG